MPWLVFGAMAICLGLLTRSTWYRSFYRSYWNRVGPRRIADSRLSRWIPLLLLGAGGMFVLIGLARLALA